MYCFLNCNFNIKYACALLCVEDCKYFKSIIPGSNYWFQQESIALWIVCLKVIGQNLENIVFYYLGCALHFRFFIFSNYAFYFVSFQVFFLDSNYHLGKFSINTKSFDSMITLPHSKTTAQMDKYSKSFWA